MSIQKYFNQYKELQRLTLEITELREIHKNLEKRQTQLLESNKKLLHTIDRLQTALRNQNKAILRKNKRIQGLQNKIKKLEMDLEVASLTNNCNEVFSITGFYNLLKTIRK